MRYQHGLPSTTCSLARKPAIPGCSQEQSWFLTLPFLYTASNIFNANQHCSVVKSCLYFICLLFLHIAAGKSSCQRSCGWKHGPCRCWPQAQLLPSQPDVAFCSVTLNVKHVDNGIVYMRLERGMWHYEACFRWHIVDRRGQWEQFWAGHTLKGWDFCVLWSMSEFLWLGDNLLLFRVRLDVN